MALPAGAQIGPYAIVGLLGEGGMGRVYRARDTRLGREVAIKVLPDAFVTDRPRLARFEREAKVLAALNDAHIAAIYGFEDAGGTPALVLELVEGPTLAERLARGPVPVDEAIRIAQQIAAALDAAHAAGVVHRDLKPANVKIRPDGTVKVLDFGLAKTVEAPGRDSDADELSTVTSPATEMGVVLGTAPYMSPEQARAQPVGRQTDVWAFGCVVFELLTGRRAFAGRTANDVIAGVLEREPAWTDLPPATPPGLRRLLRRCLEKDPARRLRDIGDARLELDDAVAAPEGQVPASRRGPFSRARWGWLAAAAVATAALIFVWVRPGPSEPELVRLSASANHFDAPNSVAVSPDGRQLAFVAAGPSSSDVVWVRALDALQARALAGTERGGQPFWSPDGHDIGFWLDGSIAKIPAAGGPVEVLANGGARARGAWSRDGTILFEAVGGLRAVSDAGGATRAVPLRDAAGHPLGADWPQFLPDGRHFLFFGGGAPAQSGLYVGSLDSPVATLLLATDFEADYAPPGDLLFVRDEAIFAQPFDASRLLLTGTPTMVADGVWTWKPAAHGAFSVSSAGSTLAYVNASLLDLQLFWFSRSGARLGAVGPPARFGFIPQISPDGSRIAIAQGVSDKQDIVLIDPAQPASSRLTFDPANDQSPVWSPDGRNVAFISDRGGGRERIWEKRADGSGPARLLFDASRSVNLQDWSRDGRFLVYTMFGPDGHLDLWLHPIEGGRDAPLLHTGFDENEAQVSPDSQWVTYVSNESGRDEVYVESFPTPGTKRQVSTNGGVQPRWRRDGREIFFLAQDQTLMAAPVTPGAVLQVGRPAELFKTGLPFRGTQAAGFRAEYDVSPDGQRFLLMEDPEIQGPPVTVVLNWTAALGR
jgi:eukaryotic-like serine/threonine-protein kinase